MGFADNACDTEPAGHTSDGPDAPDARQVAASEQSGASAGEPQPAPGGGGGGGVCIQLERRGGRGAGDDGAARQCPPVGERVPLQGDRREKMHRLHSDLAFHKHQNQKRAQPKGVKSSGSSFVAQKKDADFLAYFHAGSIFFEILYIAQVQVASLFTATRSNKWQWGCAFLSRCSKN